MYCTSCGHVLGIARFCTNCGVPTADLRTDTAERPAVSAELWTPPPTERLTESPTAPRFPLYADELAPAGLAAAAEPEPTRVVQRVAHPVQPDSPDEASGTDDRGERERRRLPMGVVTAALAVLMLLGGWLLVRGGDKEPAQAAGDTPSDPTPTPFPVPQTTPTASAPLTAPAETSDLARYATADPPRTAKPNQDLSGDVVRYVGDNMLDGVPETTWRMPGDGTGEVITFRLAEPSVITEVGLVNGYAKIDSDRRGDATNWYTRNRRITQVEWIWDDGSSVIQDLGMVRDPQVRAVEPVLTSTIRLRLVSVTGHRGRDYTAISDVVIVGGRA